MDAFFTGGSVIIDYELVFSFWPEVNTPNDKCVSYKNAAFYFTRH